MLYVIYALPPGETRKYMEDIIFQTSDKGKAESVAMLAKSKGFTNIRTATHSDQPEKPNFIKAITGKAG